MEWFKEKRVTLALLFRVDIVNSYFIINFNHFAKTYNIVFLCFLCGGFKFSENIYHINRDKLIGKSYLQNYKHAHILAHHFNSVIVATLIQMHCNCLWLKHHMWLCDSPPTHGLKCWANIRPGRVDMVVSCIRIATTQYEATDRVGDFEVVVPIVLPSTHSSVTIKQHWRSK